MPHRSIDRATLEGITQAEEAIQKACGEMDARIREKGYSCEPTQIRRDDQGQWAVVISVVGAKPFQAFLRSNDSGISIHRSQSLRTAVEQAARTIHRLPALSKDDDGAISPAKMVCL